MSLKMALKKKVKEMKLTATYCYDSITNSKDNICSLNLQEIFAHCYT